MIRSFAVGLFVSTIALTSIAAQEHPQRPVGDWHGTLDTPMGKLTLIVRLARVAPDTAITGHMESVDQAPGQKIPLAQVRATDTRMMFNIPAIGASFEGTWDAAAQSFIGTYKQGGAIPFTLTRGLPPARPAIGGLDGRWQGVLPRGDVRLRLILNVRSTSEAGTRATLDSPDLTAFGLPVDGLERRADTVRFSVPASAVTFRGTLSPDGRTLRGSWTRTGQPEATVEFVRDSVTRTARARTQWPLKDVTYTSEDVRITGRREDPGVTLAGTLTIPAGKGPFPAAVLISGSGAQDRDESMFGHQPFAVLADHLTRRGIAVLRYDDRGYGASTGDHATATSADFARDARAVVAFLKTRPEIDTRSVGLIGHSEGGLIGPIAAAEDAGIAYLVLLAGPGTNTVRIALSQRRLLGISRGVTEAELDRSEPYVVALIDEVRAGKDLAQPVLAEKVRARLTLEALRGLGADTSQREAMVQQYAGPWMRFFLAYEPARYLSKVRVPVLAIGGSLDMQVPSAENLAGLRTILARHRDATVTELPGLNHMFQTATTGAMGEYADIAETFAPGAMEMIASWIIKRTR